MVKTSTNIPIYFYKFIQFFYKYDILMSNYKTFCYKKGEPNMNLNHLHYFRVLANLEHYTKAAKQLSITQPSLSHAISLLEKDLGTQLFEKHGRNIRLTKHGLFFLNYVEKALDEISLGEQKLRELTNQTTGSIQLGFIHTLGANFIPNLMTDFLKLETYQEVKFNLGQGTTKQLIQNLKSQKYDLAFCFYLEDESDIEFIPIKSQELVLIVSPNHPLAEKNIIDLTDISDYSLITFNKEHPLRTQIDSLFDEINSKPIIRCEVEETDAVAGLVSINYGIAITLDTPLLEKSNLKVIPINHPKKNYDIYLASLKNQNISPTVTAFKEFVLSHNQNKKTLKI